MNDTPEEQRGEAESHLMWRRARLLGGEKNGKSSLSKKDDHRTQNPVAAIKCIRNRKAALFNEGKGDLASGGGGGGVLTVAWGLLMLLLSQKKKICKSSLQAHQ